jgi:TAP42-like family.
MGSIADLPLRYLTVDYLLAELLQRSYSSDRETLLRRALEYYESFLSRLDDYDLLSPNEKILYERYSENPSAFHFGAYERCCHPERSESH